MDLMTLGNKIRDTVKSQLIKDNVPNFDFGKVFSTGFGFMLGTFNTFLHDVRDSLNPAIAPEHWEIPAGFANDFLDKSVAELVVGIYHSVVHPVGSKIELRDLFANEGMREKGVSQVNAT